MGTDYKSALSGLNMYDYGFRNYDPALGRWMNIDPLAEKYYDISVYNYVDNNPINNEDPDGKEIIYGAESVVFNGPDAVAAFLYLTGNSSKGSNEVSKEKDKKKVKESEKSKSEQLISGVVSGLGDLLKAIAPIRPLEEGDPETLSEWWDGITSIPENVSGVFEYGNLEDKTRLITSSLGLLRGKKPSVSGIVKNGMKGDGKLLYFGKLAVNRDVFHKTLKPKILKSAGSFSSKVGNNPDINVVGGNIHLTGTGPFRGKTFKTDLKASDFLTH